MGYSSTPNRIAKIQRGFDKDKELLTLSYPEDRNVNRYNHFGKIIWQLSKHLKINLRYNPAIPLLGIYPRERMCPYKNK